MSSPRRCTSTCWLPCVTCATEGPGRFRPSAAASAAANAAAAQSGSLDRLVLLGSTPDGAPEALTLPKLYIATRDDASGSGPRLPGLQAHVDRAPEPKQLILLDGAVHAQFMFQTEHADRIMREILRFLGS